MLEEYDRTREKSLLQIVLQSMNVKTLTSDRCRWLPQQQQQWLDDSQLHDYLFRICHSPLTWLDVRHFFLHSVAIDNSILVLVVYDNSWVKVWAALHPMWCTNFGFRFVSQFCCVDFQRKVNATNITWGLAHAHAHIEWNPFLVTRKREKEEREKWFQWAMGSIIETVPNELMRPFKL